jgi:hypothetical protein
LITSWSSVTNLATELADLPKRSSRVLGEIMTFASATRRRSSASIRCATSTMISSPTIHGSSSRNISHWRGNLSKGKIVLYPHLVSKEITIHIIYGERIQPSGDGCDKGIILRSETSKKAGGAFKVIELLYGSNKIVTHGFKGLKILRD